MGTDCGLTTQEINRLDERVLRKGEKDTAFRIIKNYQVLGLSRVILADVPGCVLRATKRELTGEDMTPFAEAHQRILIH
jgi:hypothetical protein